MEDQRKKIRKTILTQRSCLSIRQQQLASELIAKRLSKTLLFYKSRRIAFYFANKGEVDPSLLLKKAIALNKECYLPILDPLKHNRMWFARYRSGDALKKNCFGILEPDLKYTEQVWPTSLDIVITPLVAFDCQGHRLGMGKGFYDRTFSFKRNNLGNKPLLIGLAYSFQQQAPMRPQAWDINLDLVVTENDFHLF